MDFFAQTAALLMRLYPSLISGFAITIAVALIAMPLSLLGGLVLLPLRLWAGRAAKWSVGAYVKFMRNTLWLKSRLHAPATNNVAMRLPTANSMTKRLLIPSAADMDGMGPVTLRRRAPVALIASVPGEPRIPQLKPSRRGSSSVP